MSDIEDRINQLHQDHTQMSQKVEDIHKALIGDLHTQGWLSRLHSVESEVYKHRKWFGILLAKIALIAGWIITQLFETHH